jgi:ribonuclease Z
VRDAKVLIVECTFFDPEHVTRARAGRHVHVADMPGLMEQVRCPNVVLIHLSQRTDIRAARRILADTLPEADLARITFLMERPPQGRRDRKDKEHTPTSDGQ